jgi:hypothetical protein
VIEVEGKQSMFSVDQFCRFVGISRTLFYAVQRQGNGPALTRIGRRVLIAKDTANEWLKGREEAA